MHGDAAGRALGAAGAAIVTERVDSLDELDADVVIVAVPPRESARLLGEPESALEESPIVSVHLWFDRKLLVSPLAALLDSDAHWVFDRGVPQLLEVRGHDLVDQIAGQLTDRLGAAELLRSRVSREPHATIALRPGVVRPGVDTERPGVVRAGTW